MEWNIFRRRAFLPQRGEGCLKHTSCKLCFVRKLIQNKPLHHICHPVAGFNNIQSSEGFLNFGQVALMKYFLLAGRFLFSSSQYLVVNIILWWWYQLLIHSFMRDIEGWLFGFLAGTSLALRRASFSLAPKDYHDNQLTSPTVNTS